MLQWHLVTSRLLDFSNLLPLDLGPKALSISLRDFRVNPINLHTVKIQIYVMTYKFYICVLLMCPLGHINLKPSHLHNTKTIAQQLMGLISIAECISD